MFLLVCNSSNIKFYGSFTGDEHSIGAVVYFDNFRIGVLEEFVSTGEFCDLPKGYRAARARLLLPIGKHTMKIVAIDGSEIVKNVEINNEAYFVINMEKQLIGGSCITSDSL